MGARNANLIVLPHPRSLFGWACGVELYASCADGGQYLRPWPLVTAVAAARKDLDPYAAQALARYGERVTDVDPLDWMAQRRLEDAGVPHELFASPGGAIVVRQGARDLRSLFLAYVASKGRPSDDAALVQVAPVYGAEWRVPRDVAIDMCAGAFFLSGGKREVAADFLNRGVPSKGDGLRSDHVRNAVEAFRKRRFKNIDCEVMAAQIMYETMLRFGAAKLLWADYRARAGVGNTWALFHEFRASGQLLEDREAKMRELHIEHQEELGRRIDMAVSFELGSYAKRLEKELRRRSVAA